MTFKNYVNFFKNFDFFGTIFNFRIQQKDAYQTRFGGAVFILFLIFSIFYFILSFKEFIAKKIYTINFSEKVVSPAPKINFKEVKFYFAYTLQFDNGTFLDKATQKYFSQKVTLKSVINSTDSLTNRTVLRTAPCSLKTFYGENMEKHFNQLKLNNYTCVDEKTNILLQGVFTDDLFVYLEIAISLNTSLNFTEEQLSDLGKMLYSNPIKLILYWIDTTLDVNNIDKPISSYINSYITLIDFSMLKKTDLFFSLFNFSDDKNLLFKTEEGRDNLIFDRTSEYSIIIPKRTSLPKDSTMVKLFLRSSSFIKIIDRSYLKLNGFLAQLAGLISNLYLILFVVISFFNKFWGGQKLMNKLFKYREFIRYVSKSQFEKIKFNLREDINNKNNYRISKDQSSFSPKIEIELNDLNKDRDVSRLTIHHQNLYTRKKDILLEEEYQVIGQLSRPICFSFKEIIMRVFSCSSSLYIKNKLYDEALSKIEYYLDIFTYLKKVQEIDLLKYLLLNNDQIRLFNFISKPSISCYYSSSDDIYQDGQNNREFRSKILSQEVESILKSYNALKKDEGIMNKQLFYLFEYEIDHLLKD